VKEVEPFASQSQRLIEATVGDVSDRISKATADKLSVMFAQVTAQIEALQKTSDRIEATHSMILQQLEVAVDFVDVSDEARPRGSIDQVPALASEVSGSGGYGSAPASPGTSPKKPRPQTTIANMLDAMSQAERSSLAAADENKNHVGSHLFAGLSEDKKKRKKLVKAFTKNIPCSPKEYVKRWQQSAAHKQVDRFVSTDFFDAFFGFLIVLNAVLIGAEVQYRTNHDDVHIVFQISQYVFCFLFVFEFVCRLGAYGPFYFGRKGWGYFDLAMVCVSCMEVLDAITDVGSRSVRLQVFMKVTRMVRLLRIVRVFKFSAHLQIMVFMIIESFKSLFSTVVLLLIILYIFALCFTIGATDYLDDKLLLTENQRAAKNFFGSVYDSALTCFQSMTSGLSWFEVIDPLRGMGDIYVIVFLFFIVFSLFVLVNIITGVFVDHALAKSQTERDLVVEKEITMKKACVQNLKELFTESDADKSGTVDYDEFMKHLQNPRVLAYMSALKLDTSNLVELFNKLDADGNGSIEVEEFVERCMYMMRAQSTEQYLMRLKDEIADLKINLVRGLAELQEQSLNDADEFREILQKQRQFSPAARAIPKLHVLAA